MRGSARTLLEQAEYLAFKSNWDRFCRHKESVLQYYTNVYRVGNRGRARRNMMKTFLSRAERGEFRQNVELADCLSGDAGGGAVARCLSGAVDQQCCAAVAGDWVRHCLSLFRIQRHGANTRDRGVHDVPGVSFFGRAGDRGRAGEGETGGDDWVVAPDTSDAVRDHVGKIDR